MSYQRRQLKLQLAAAAAEAEKASQKETRTISNTTKPANRNTRVRKKKNSAPVFLGMFKAKILVIGPCESGKTVLSNFLSDATETSGGDYHPTQGVRFSTCWPAIQKDTNGVVIVYNPDQPNHDKELETCDGFFAGNKSYVIGKPVDGFPECHVTNPNILHKNILADKESLEKMLEYTQFVQEQWLRDSQCLVFAHHKPMAPERVRAQVPQTLSKVSCVHTNLDEDPDAVREEFKNFLGQVLSNLTDKRDQEELSIMNN